MTAENEKPQGKENSAGFSFKFKRIEKKFWMNEEQYGSLIGLIEDTMIPDKYGESTVCNVYYDTPDYMLIRNSIERPLFKEKLRVRSYGVPTEDSNVFIELKRKLNGVGYKRRAVLPYSQAMRLLRGEAVGCGDIQVRNEILDFVARYSPQPKVFIGYERFALYGKDDPEFRITFDRNLRYRTENPEMINGSDGLPFVKGGRDVLMEIKTSGGVPLYITEELSRLKIFQAPFSKVGECFTSCIAPRLSFD